MTIDKHLVSVSDEFNWILASDTDTLSICQTQPIFTNTETAMLSNIFHIYKHKTPMMDVVYLVIININVNIVTIMIIVITCRA